MAMVISGATIIDGVADKPTEGRSIWIEGGRIKAIGSRDDVGRPPGAKVIDARGKYVIPGLMNANVHLLMDMRLETLVRHLGNYEGVIAEAAQIALKGGLTTVFDTWGPRRFLMKVRDEIDAGKRVGSRVFCGGNIVGLDGPLSRDFFKSESGASAALTNHINAIWVENVGRHLMWQPPERVAREVRTYIGKGVDFIKYASNGHGGAFGSAFLAFSSEVQAAIVGEAHRAGLTAQAHTTTVEGLRMAAEAGCELVQHANMTGPATIPEKTLELLSKRSVGAVIFPFTQRRLDWIKENASDADRTLWGASDINARNLIACGAPLLAATDGWVWTPDMKADPLFDRAHLTPGDDNLFDIATGHFAWFRAMEEKGCAPRDMLRAATRNIAVAYGKDKDLGTLEPDKIADMLILDRNPLQAAANYRSIRTVIKDGAVVNVDALPENPVLTKPLEPAQEEASYISFLTSEVGFPLCPMCMRG